MKNFNKEEFDKVDKCKHCDYKFHEHYNNRKITLVEKIDKIKLKKLMIMEKIILIKRLKII